MNTQGQSDYPSTGLLTFQTISAGGQHSCALTDKLHLSMPLCWGNNDEGQSELPVEISADYGGCKMISVGLEHTCVVRRSGGVTCWGQDSYGQSEVPQELDARYNDEQNKSLELQMTQRSALSKGQNGGYSSILHLQEYVEDVENYTNMKAKKSKIKSDNDK